MSNLNQKIQAAIQQGISAIEQLAEPRNINFIERAASLLSSCFAAGKKVLIAGNGGSCCDAAHFAEELTGFFREKRPALPAIALTDPGHLTCVANDVGFEQVFARAIEAYGQPGDIFIGLSTSGNSANLVTAFETASERGLHTISFLGKTGGALLGRADLELLIAGFKSSDRVQEAHMAALHIIIEITEEHLFKPRIKEEVLEMASSK